MDTLDPSTQLETPSDKGNGQDLEATEPSNEFGAPPGGERTIRGFRWILVVFSILSSTFLFAMDTTVVADVQPNIIDSLGEFEKFPWLGSAFVLPSAAVILPWSKAYSLLDIKWLYFTHVTLFEIGSAIAGAAPTMDALIVGRAIAGIGGCGMYVGGMTFLSVVTTTQERPVYISLVTPVWGLGTVLGPVIGGAFAESSVGWRWGFYINLFIFAAVAPVMIFMLPSLNFARDMPVRQKLAKFDWLGFVVYAGWCVAFIMALQFGGSVYAWDSASEIILWVMTGVLPFAFALTHLYHPFIDAENRFFPAHMLKNLKFGILQIATMTASGAVYIPIYYIPLFFQFARGETPVQAAVKLLPFVFMIVTVAILSGVFISKVGYIMPWFLIGAILSVAGAALMYTVTPDTSTSAIYGYSVLLGLGGGCGLLSAFGCASAVVDDKDVFNAVGVLGVAQAIGIVFFISTAGIIFQNLGVQYISPFLPTDFSGSKNAILAGASSAAFRALSGGAQHAVGRAIVEAISKTYMLAVAGCALTVVVTPFLGKAKVV